MCWLKILSYFLTLKGSVIFWESLRFILERVFHDPSCFSHSPHPNSGHFPRAPYHSSHILASLSLLVPSFFSHLNYLFHLSKASYFQNTENIPCPRLASSFVRLVQVIILFLKVRGEKRGALMYVCLVFTLIFLLSSIGWETTLW